MTLEPTLTTFSPEDMESFLPEMKIGMLATINPDGEPHLTLISTLQASSPTQMTWGQFTEGLSKAYIRANPRVGWMIMSLQKEVWRGKATFTHTSRQGPDYERYNQIPMFRYNAYFGVHTVYYMDLVAHSGKEPLPMGAVVFGAVQTMLARLLHRDPEPDAVLNPYTRTLFNKVDNLKYLAYIDADGYPAVLPCIQAQAYDSSRLAFTFSAYGEQLGRIPAGARVAVYGMTLGMETVLVRGTYAGVRRPAGYQLGVVDVDWVYNAMPPVPGQIYPPVPLEAVESW